MVLKDKGIKKKLELKDAIHAISISLGEIEVSKENIKTITDQVKEERDKDVSYQVNKLAKLLHDDKLSAFLDDADSMQALNDKLFK